MGGGEEEEWMDGEIRGEIILYRLQSISSYGRSMTQEEWTVSTYAQRPLSGWVGSEWVGGKLQPVAYTTVDLSADLGTDYLDRLVP